MALLLHLALLLLCASAVARAVAVDRLHRILVMFTVAWAAVVLAAEILSPASLLGSSWIFAVLTLVLAFAAAWASRRRLSRPDPRDAPALAADPHKHFVWPLLWAAALAAVVLAFIGFAYHTNNPDCVQGYLPRVVFVRDQGHLGHLPQSDDFRKTFTPTNGIVAHLYVLLLSSSDFAFPTFNLLCWLIAVVGIAALAKELGAPASAAWLAALGAGLSSGPMMQAAATNFDLAATAPLVAGLVFVSRWIRRGLARYAVLGGLALGLSIGTKPSFYFFLPWGLFCALVALAAILRRRLWPDAGARRIAFTTTLFVAATLLLGSSWLVRNRFYGGRFTPKTESLDNARWMNPGFNLESAGRGLALHTVQHLLHPFAALAPDMAVGENLLWRTLNLKRWLPVQPPGGRGFPFQLGYRPICEDTAWFGFFGALLWLPAILFGLLPHAHRSLPAFLLAGSAVAWLLTYYGLTTWYPWNGRYALMPVAVSAPVVAVLLAWLQRRVLVRTYAVLIGAVSALIFLSFAVDFSLAACRNLRRNAFEAVDNARRGRRKHFLSYGAVKDGQYYSFDCLNLLKDLRGLARDIPDVSYLNGAGYGRSYATMTALNFEKRFLWRGWELPQRNSELVALPYDISLLFTPSNPSNAAGFVLPAIEEGTAIFSLPATCAGRLPASGRFHPFVAFYLTRRTPDTHLFCYGQSGALKYRLAGQSRWHADTELIGPASNGAVWIEFDEDDDGTCDATAAIAARRRTFEGGYPAPPMLVDSVRRLRNFKTLREWSVRSRTYADSEPFDVEILLRRNGSSDPWRVAGRAAGVFDCNLEDLPIDLSALDEGSWSVLFGIGLSKNPNRTLPPPYCFDDYVIFDIELKK